MSKPISSEKDLTEVLNIENLNELSTNSDARIRLLESITEIAPELLPKVFEVAPVVIEAIQANYAKFCNLAENVESTKRTRYETLAEICKTGNLTGDQVIEFIKIITEAERSEQQGYAETLNKTQENTSWIQKWGMYILGAVAIALAGGAAGYAKGSGSNIPKT